MQSIWRTIADSIERLSTARPGYAAAALALYVLSLFLAGARWRGFLRALGGNASVMRATLATLGGIAAGNLAPPPGGEAVRIALLRLGGRTTWQQATAAAVWDRLSEVPPIAVLSVMALVAVRSLASERVVAVAAVILATIVIVCVAIWRLRRPTFEWTLWRDVIAPHGVGGPVFAAGVGYSSLLWAQDFLRLTCVTLAFGVVLPPTRVATLCVVAMLGGLVPGIAGLGPIEGGLVAGLLAFGVDLPTAAAVTALERAVSYGFSTSAGGLVIALLGGRSVWNNRSAGPESL